MGWILYFFSRVLLSFTSPITLSIHIGARVSHVTTVLTSLLTVIHFFLMYIQIKLTVFHSFLFLIEEMICFFLLFLFFYSFLLSLSSLVYFPFSPSSLVSTCPLSMFIALLTKGIFILIYRKPLNLITPTYFGSLRVDRKHNALILFPFKRKFRLSVENLGKTK